MTTKSFSETTLFHWTSQLIGNSSRFLFNLSTISLVGIAYAFKLTTSPVLLGIFGLLNPAFLTICVYRFMQELPKNLITGGISLGPFSGKRRVWMLLVDVGIIVALSLYIHLGHLNYFVFRFLLLFLLPMMLLVGLRFLYILYLINLENPTLEPKE